MLKTSALHRAEDQDPPISLVVAPLARAEFDQNLSGLQGCNAVQRVAVDRGLWQERAPTTTTTERNVYF
jgi:hypothetical protein